jgi:hypothetical protein
VSQAGVLGYDVGEQKKFMRKKAEQRDSESFAEEGSS